MQFEQYPSYKNSGVEWLGDVPEHWQVKPNKYVFKIQKRIAGTLGFNVLSITQKGLKIKDIESNAGQMAQDYSKYQIVNIGDFAMNHMDLLTGWIDIAKVKGVTSPDYRVFEVRNKKVNKEYFLHLFQLGYRNKILFAFGQGAAQMGRWRLQSETFNTLKMPFPSIEEQEKIVAFLDTETTRIDNLIAKQEKLIELLEEQRKSIISHAVTKGLNPNAPMKDSGVEWLGDVPESWEVIPSKFYFTERKEKAVNGDKQLTASQKHGIIYQDEFIAENGRVMVVMKNPEILKKVRPNDFVISMRSFQGGLELSSLEGSISSAYVMLKPDLSLINTEYFKYLFKTPRYIQSLQSTSNLIRDGQALRFNNFSQVKLVLPPKSEQQEIVEYLDKEKNKIDNLIYKQKTLIEKLKEYRASIISHAVTGKIDVREFGA